MNQRRSDVVVLFGATGDLASRQLFPALFALHRRGRLGVPVIGVARSVLDDEAFRKRVRDSIRADGRHTEAGGVFPDAEIESFTRRLSYIDGDYSHARTFQDLDQALARFSNPLFYLAIPPAMFDVVSRGIRSIRCGSSARVVVEKPFGHDRESAQELNRILYRCFDEDALFRADHFLAMESVANLMYVRFANMVLQPLWFRRYIKNIQITMAEDFGIADRGAFYDQTGVVRDVIQNHLFQVLGLLAMEPPLGGDHVIDALHNAQLDIFRNVRPVEPEDVVFGQFEGYHNVPGVRPDSRTETWAAMRLHIDSNRWRDVPFYIRAGKCMPLTCTEVFVTFRTDGLPDLGGNPDSSPNVLRFRLFPGTGIALRVLTKQPGPGLDAKAAELRADLGADDNDAPYERVIDAAIAGDHAIFTRAANMDAAWRIVDDILVHDRPVIPYEPGSWGPSSADDILLDGDTWWNPEV